MPIPGNQLRNVAIIAHVDHGKRLWLIAFYGSPVSSARNEQVVDRVLDSNDLERERGITILAKTLPSITER